MALRLVSSKTTKIAIGDDDFIEVRNDISRRAFNDLLSRLPAGVDVTTGIDFATASSFAEGLFEAFVVGWSVQDESGKAVKPTLDNYQLLSRESSTLIDNAITEHFNGLSPNDADAIKSEGRSEE